MIKQYDMASCEPIREPEYAVENKVSEAPAYETELRLQTVQEAVDAERDALRQNHMPADLISMDISTFILSQS